MNVDRRALRLQVAVAVAPVVSNLFMVAMLEASTAGLLTQAQSSRALAVVFGPVATVNVLLTFGAPVVSAAVAFALAFTEDRTVGGVLAGVAAGAAAYGVGVATVGWVGGMQSPFPGGHVRLAVWLALLFGGTGALGALAGDTVGPLFRAPEGEDGQHPRW